MCKQQTKNLNLNLCMSLLTEGQSMEGSKNQQRKELTFLDEAEGTNFN